MERLIEDLTAARTTALAWGAELPSVVDTLYFGGGTPSLLPPESIERIMTAIRREFTVLPEAEITFEVAPATLSDATLDAMAASGATRLSFGVQSFIDAEAQAVGRKHRREDVLHDLERARRAGITDLNLDLLAGLPGQTLASWRESLAVLGETGVSHASVYMLEVDEDSRLGTELLAGGTRYGAQLVPNEEAIATMYEEAIQTLAEQGLAQYEISNFARPGAESRHNLRYWERRPYLGLGVDAHSMLRGASSTGPSRRSPVHFSPIYRGPAMRFATTERLEAYLEAPGWLPPTPLTWAEELEEAWFLGLRRNAGVSLKALTEEFGPAPVEACAGAIESLLADGLIDVDGLIGIEGQRVRLTATGRLLSNEVFTRFLAD